MRTTFREVTTIFLLSSFLIARPAFSQLATGTNTASLRQAYFGDLHLHTSYSFDAYASTSITPVDAYRFARGEPIDFLGVEIKRSTPSLDFMAITDHSENIGVIRSLDEADSPLSQSDLGREARKQGLKYLTEKILAQLSNGRHGNLAKITGVNEAALNATAASAWRRTIEAANRNYEPGKFTTFIGYEWTCTLNWQNLHRNVIYRGDDAPVPFTSIDSCRPEDLWAFLENSRKRGYEALAIPHNSNASNGLMFDWFNSDGNRIDARYAGLRAANEPLVEIYQIKGQSETHPALSQSDEFANFEILDFMQSSREGAASRAGGSYVRDALGRGMEVAQSADGINPFRYGFVGASDDHAGLSDSSEDALANHAMEAGPLDSKSPLSERFRSNRDGSDEDMKSQLQSTAGLSLYALGSPGLTGVWAEQNTRESIYAALRRRETFATSGTRLKLRFFGGWDYSSNLTQKDNWLRTAYDSGVPMGEDLPLLHSKNKKKAPKFAIWAVKDPVGANLDRAQIVKVWLEGGTRVEKVFDVALANERIVNASTGRAPAVGNTVDVANATYSNAIGATELSTVWEDPHFEPSVPSAYYLRVLEIPTPRHTTISAVKYHLPLLAGVPVSIQERGWSSPIWYTPPVRQKRK